MSEELARQRSDPSCRTDIQYSEYLRITTRRELVWSLSRRGIRTTQIIKILNREGLLAGITSPLHTIRKDRALGLKVARRLRAAGNIEEAEADYIGNLKELYSMACSDRNLQAARDILHDIAYAHGIEIKQPLSPVFIGNVNVQRNTLITGASGNGHDTTETELRSRLKTITAEFKRVVGSSGIDQGPASSD